VFHVRTAVLDPGFESFALFGRQRIATVIVPDHQFEFCQLFLVHDGAVLCHEVGVSPFVSDCGERSIRTHDAAVIPKAIGLRVDEDGTGLEVRRQHRWFVVIGSGNKSAASATAGVAKCAAIGAASRGLRDERDTTECQGAQNHPFHSVVHAVSYSH